MRWPALTRAWAGAALVRPLSSAAADDRAPVTGMRKRRTLDGGAAYLLYLLMALDGDTLWCDRVQRTGIGSLLRQRVGCCRCHGVVRYRDICAISTLIGRAHARGPARAAAWAAATRARRSGHRVAWRPGQRACAGSGAVGTPWCFSRGHSLSHDANSVHLGTKLADL